MSEILHRGRHAYRLAPDQNNPREVALAEQWAYENEENRAVGQLLAMLVCTRPATKADMPLMPWAGGMVQDRELTQRDAEVAATVIQWLGSNVGWCFLGEALKRTGYRIVKLDAEGR